jgi:DNA polymerase-3 subunit epsilon
LKRLGRPQLEMGRATDTLAIARRKFPNGKNSLDALASRFNITNFNREFHGALLDSEILAEVYLELIGGRQRGLLDSDDGNSAGQNASGKSNLAPLAGASMARARPRPLATLLTPEEDDAHSVFVETLGADAVWKKH